jgi:hypothetical protein
MIVRAVRQPVLRRGPLEQIYRAEAWLLRCFASPTGSWFFLVLWGLQVGASGYFCAFGLLAF